MSSDDDYGRALSEAERELREAATADEVRNVWKKHIGALGHRALGRLLMGRSAGELAERRAERKERD